MKTQIVHISKLQTAKVMALLYLVISIPMALLMFLPSLTQQQSMAWGLVVAMPVMYTIIGFVFTFLGAWVYNGIAGRIGGIEFTVAERGED